MFLHQLSLVPANISGSSSAEQSVSRRSIIVNPGGYLYSISRKYSVPVAALQKINTLVHVGFWYGTVFRSSINDKGDNYMGHVERLFNCKGWYIWVGSNYPVVVQSMTNTDTEDALGSAIQIADLVRRFGR